MPGPTETGWTNGNHRTDDESTGSYGRLPISSWPLVGASTTHPAVFDGWNALWEGLAAMEDRRLVVLQRLDHGESCFEWRIRPVAAY